MSRRMLCCDETLWLKARWPHSRPWKLHDGRKRVSTPSKAVWDAGNGAVRFISGMSLVPLCTNELVDQ